MTGDQPGEGFVAPAEDLVRAFWHGAMVAAAPVGPHDADVRLVARAVVSASGAQTTGMDDEQASRVTPPSLLQIAPSSTPAAVSKECR